MGMNSLGNGKVAKERIADGRHQAAPRYARFPLSPRALVANVIRTEIYASDTDYRRECSYYIALGYYKLGNYGHARRFNGTYLASAP